MEVQVGEHTVKIETARIREQEDRVRLQVGEYLAGEREGFELTWTAPDGFLGRLMEALVQVPYGETRTYGQLAEVLGTAPVAVGQACSRNPLPLIVPCHRVVGIDDIGGYQYPGLKERLLAMESGGDAVR